MCCADASRKMLQSHTDKPLFLKSPTFVRLTLSSPLFIHPAMSEEKNVRVRHPPAETLVTSERVSLHQPSLQYLQHQEVLDLFEPLTAATTRLSLCRVRERSWCESSIHSQMERLWYDLTISLGERRGRRHLSSCLCVF